MNIQPLWTLVDNYRSLANSLEHEIKVLTGDEPEDLTFGGGDRISAYTAVVRALAEAANELHDIADSEGRSIGHRRSIRARVIANRCSRALDDLAKAGEL